MHPAQLEANALLVRAGMLRGDADAARGATIGLSSHREGLAQLTDTVPGLAAALLDLDNAIRSIHRAATAGHAQAARLEAAAERREAEAQASS